MKKRPKILVFVRHGENVENDQLLNSELPLSEEGVKQAMWAKSIIINRCNRFDAVISSTSKRSAQTAMIINDRLCDSEIICDSELLEAGYGTRLETESDAKRRAQQVLTCIFDEYDSETVMVVAHGCLVAIMEEILDGTAPRRTIENCAITIYSGQKTNGGFRCKETVKPYEKSYEQIDLGVNIYFARHGESTSNRDGILAGGMDFTLTRNGLDQAKFLADRLNSLDVAFAKIYSSPLSRARETAEAIAKRCGLANIEECLDLTGCGGGSLEGQPYAKWYAIPSEDLWEYGVEACKNQLVRAKRVIRYILHTQKYGDNVIVVSHSSLYQVLYAVVVGIEDEEAIFKIAKPGVGDYSIITL